MQLCSLSVHASINKRTEVAFIPTADSKHVPRHCGTHLVVIARKALGVELRGAVRGSGGGKGAERGAGHETCRHGSLGQGQR